MLSIRPLAEGFAVAPQIAPEDFAAIAAAGYTFVLNNRPDGEGADQPPPGALAAGARAAGLSYAHVPFSGAPGLEEAAAAEAALRDGGHKVLAFCRSGTRSAGLWALMQARAGADLPAALAAARTAGYDLSGLMPLLASARPR
jgi:uncharacterized protein (TIGR01244 family)